MRATGERVTPAEYRDRTKETAMTEYPADLRHHAAHPNRQHLDLLVQTESPSTVVIREMAPRARWGKTKVNRWALTAYGDPRWVPGAGCRGGWSIDGVTPETLSRLAADLDATVVVYLYPGCPVPAHLTGCPVYEGDGTGWQRTRVEP